MADWGNLPKDIVTNIVERLELYEDFETILQICSCWRSAAKESKFRGACNNGVESHTLPLLMLPERDESSNIRRFYSVSKHMIRHISLPVPDNSKKRLLSSNGWLLVVFQRENRLYLFEPFSRAIIELPELEDSVCLLEPRWYRKHNRVWRKRVPYKFILSADPSTTSSFAVFLSCTPVSECLPSILYFWRNGHRRWTRVVRPTGDPQLGLGSLLPSSQSSDYHCHDVTFYQGEFYGVDINGRVAKFETRSSSFGYSPYVVGRVLKDLPQNMTSGSDNGELIWLHYLVESVGQLLVVRQGLKCRIHYKKKMKLDVNNGNIKQVESLGNRAIFIGNSASFSALVDVSYTASVHGCGFKPNCIYYTDDESVWKGPAQHCKHHCVYNLNKCNFERIFYTGPSSQLGNLTQLMWVESPK